MSPSGFRTATAQLDGPRIITPSRTACPPTVVKVSLAHAERVGRRPQTDARASSRVLKSARKRCRGPVHHHALEDRLSADGGQGRGLGAAGAAGLLEPALEALDASARVDQLLLARVERVAVGADLDVQLGLRGAGLERVPAGTGDGREDVVGMDLRLHPNPG